MANNGWIPNLKFLWKCLHKTLQSIALTTLGVKKFLENSQKKTHKQIEEVNAGAPLIAVPK